MLFSEPKIPQSATTRWGKQCATPFSALQRAENSSIGVNVKDVLGGATFSALQRAENSSIPPQASPPTRRASLSVLFSEPKIPQSYSRLCSARSPSLSVLFSEPKIPQSLNTIFGTDAIRAAFSALQRAENSSIRNSRAAATRALAFQCSSASRKFLNRRRYLAESREGACFQCSSASRKFLNFGRELMLWDAQLKLSVLFSEPKIPQSVKLRAAAKRR